MKSTFMLTTPFPQGTPTMPLQNKSHAALPLSALRFNNIMSVNMQCILDDNTISFDICNNV